MNKLGLMMSICMVAAVQQKASAQEPRAAALAYDFCYAIGGEGGLEPQCDIHILKGATVETLQIGGISPRWSPDGTRVAFTGWQSANWGPNDLFVLTIADGSIASLTNDVAVERAPRWSPDGTRIAFESDRSGALELYVVNADGSHTTRLTQNVGFQGPAAWSPDGASIAFSRAVDGAQELYRMNADGLNPTRLTYGVGFDGAIAWSPDGLRLAFNCLSGDICAVDPNGTSFVQLTNEPGFTWGAAFAPVGGRIAFVAGSEISVLEADGTVVRIAAGVTTASLPTWSSNGETIAFEHMAEGGYACPADGSCIIGAYDDLYVVNADGTGIWTIGGAHNPAWTPSTPGGPVATLTSSCTGSECRFDATRSFDRNGTIASYQWHFGDGSVASGSTALHTYSTGARYDVTLIVTDQGGDTGFSRTRVLANTPPMAAFIVACDGPTCTFDASGSSDPDGTITMYDLWFGDHWMTSSRSVLQTTHTYPTGMFTATLRVTDNAGVETLTSRTVSTVNAVPVAAFTVACTKLTCTYDASGSTDDEGTIARYSWQFGDGRTRTDSGVGSYTYDASGTYALTLTVVDGEEQSSTATKTVSVALDPFYAHVGDLDGWRTLQGSTWSAFVTIKIEDATHGYFGGTTVTGKWENGTVASCVTAWSGVCMVSRDQIPKKTASVTFTVSSATHGTLAYKGSLNHDAEGDSNGTTIKVVR